MLWSLVPLWTAGSQFPGLLRQQVLDELEVSGRVSTFSRGGGTSTWVTRLHLVLILRNKRIASRVCHSVFLQPMRLCLQKDLSHKASQGADPIQYWPPVTANLLPLVVRRFLVWDATRRELWETAVPSTTHRLPARELTLRVMEVTWPRPCDGVAQMLAPGHRSCRLKATLSGADSNVH